MDFRKKPASRPGPQDRGGLSLAHRNEDRLLDRFPGLARPDRGMSGLDANSLSIARRGTVIFDPKPTSWFTASAGT